MAYTEKTYQLDSFGVDSVSDDLQAWLDSAGVDRRDALRIRLTMEELLLRVSERSDGVRSATLRMGKRFGTPFLRFRYSGEKMNPMEEQENGANGWTDQILTNLGLAPAWSYRAGRNELTLRIPHTGHRSELLLLVALVSAIVLGLLGGFLPDSVALFLSDNLFTPLSNAFLHLLNTFAPLLIFFSVMTGICGIGSTAELGKVGKLMLTRFLLFSFLDCVLITILARPFFSLTTGAAAGAGDLSITGSLIDLILNILPSDPITPFSEGNTLQIVFLAILTGATLLLLGTRGMHVRNFISDFNNVILEIMRCICKFLPIYIFTSLVTQFWDSGITLILQLWKPILVCAGICALFFIAKTVLVGLQLKANVGKLLRIHLPASLVGFSTASSVSAFGLCTDICEKKLGISSDLTRTGLSIGGILYAFSYSTLYVIIAFYAAECYGVEVNFIWFFLSWLLCSIFGIATPPISGGTLACLSIMLTQLGIPMEALAISSTLSLLLDFICTGFRICPLNLEIAVQADKLGMLDRTVLQNNAGRRS